MKERLIESVCPHCQHSFWIKRDTMAIAGIHPSVEELLDQGVYFSHQCSQCKTVYYMNVPFLFRDPDKKYIIVLSDKKEISNLPKDEEVIRVQTPKEFLFVYHIKKQGLNLAMVKQIKNALEQREGKEVLYDGYDEKDGCLWFLSDDQPKAIPLTPDQMQEIKK